MVRRRPLALLGALLALALAPAAAAAHGDDRVRTLVVDGELRSVAVHSDPEAAMPDRLVTRPVAQQEFASPVLGVDFERSGGLPETWCGTPTAADDTANEVVPATGPHFKLVYAHAADQADRFDQLADKLQASVSLLSRYLAGQSGGAKTLRFDLGTSCGPEYADIQTVALPQPLSYYVVGGAPQFDLIAADVRAAVALASGTRRNLLVYADAMLGTDGIGGAGERYISGGEVAGAANPHNDGGLLAAAFGDAAVPAGTYAEPATLMHEAGHNLGAVQAGAPHVTDPVDGGHCTDEHDVMCYADGGPNNTLTFPCDTRDGEIVDSTFDCGGDDYFNPAPEPASYLATSWNTYDSAHLADCTDPGVGAACGVAADAAPVNTTPLPPAGWVQGPYAVTLSATDADGDLDKLQWRLNGSAEQDAADGDPISVEGDGVHSLETQAVDLAGHTSGWREDTVRIDGSLPNDLTDPGTTAWRNTPVTVTVAGSDAVSGLDRMEWRVDGGTVQSGPSGSQVTISADGARTLSTRAVDAAGNVSAWRDHTIRVDTVLPADDTAAPAGWQTAPLAVTVTGSDAHSGVAQVRWRIGAAGAESTGPNGSVATVSGDGEHTLYTRVQDTAGNWSGWKSHTIRIDTTAPDNQTPAAGSAWSAADYSVLVKGADGGSGLARVEWRVNGGAVTHGPSGIQADITGTGAHSFETRAVDSAGNASAWRAETIRIDRLRPDNTTPPAPAAPVPNPYAVTLGGDDLHSGVAYLEWQVDAGTVHTAAPGDEIEIAGSGPSTLRTRVVDAAGNASDWRAETVTIDPSLNNDTTPPTDTTTAAPAGWATGDVAITIAATDAGAGVRYLKWRLGGAPIQTHEGASKAITFSADGVHTLETKAVDRAGQESAWRRQTIRIDRTVPSDTTAIGPGWQDSRTFTVTAEDGHSGVAAIEYSIDNGPWESAAPGAGVTVADDGVYEIQHRAIDHAEHASALRTSELKVDTVAPDNTTAVPSAAWSTTALELPLSGDDDRSGVAALQWRVDGGPIRDDDPVVFDADGEYALETRAVDAAGNASAWRPDTVRIDLTAPTNLTPAAPAGWRSTPYRVRVAGADGDGSGVAAVQRTLNGGAVSTVADVTLSADGVHTLRTRIVDGVGRASPWRADTIRIDRKPPALDLRCGAGWNATCTLAADGGPSGLRSLTLSRDGGPARPVARGTVPVPGDGVHRLAVTAIDGAGNRSAAQAVVRIDRTAPAADLACAGHACRVTASDAASGVASLTYSVDGGAWTAPAADGTFTVAAGAVRARAVDGAGHATVTAPLTVEADPEPEGDGEARTASRPVYLRGREVTEAMIGALRATRTASGAVKVDLRPLALGKGRYRVKLRVKSGKRVRNLKRTVRVRKGGASPRIRTRLARAPKRAKVTLRVHRRKGGRWRRHATARVRL